jgi:hypothetical protein
LANFKKIESHFGPSLGVLDSASVLRNQKDFNDTTPNRFQRRLASRKALAIDIRSTDIEHLIIYDITPRLARSAGAAWLFLTLLLADAWRAKEQNIYTEP